MSIVAASSADAGNYHVVVSNSAGSITSSVAKLTVLPLQSPLDLAIVGNGTVTGATNGQSLVIGANFALTAKPGTGFAFANWTSNLLPATNSATIRFMMVSNLALTANFVDITRPTLSIISPLAGQVFSNSVVTMATNSLFAVRGTAADNVGVSSVWYRVNGNGWTNAVGMSNWLGSVALQPGPNVIQAYAADAAGNNSITSSVAVKYLLTAQLMVQTNQPGWGTILPNLNNSWLVLGTNYTLTATAATGFRFLNWTNNSGQIFNAAGIAFKMQTNLAWTANFADVTRPTLSITNPTAGERVSNSVITINGRAGDNAQVASVWLQLNGGDWTYATGTTNWTATASLLPGTNVVSAYAVDTSGNKSLTNRVSFDFVVPSLLTVQTIGLGTISPNFSNAWMEIGRNYSLTARPGTGFAFGNWSGRANSAAKILTNGATVEFTMSSNLVLTATFVDELKPLVTFANLRANQRLGTGMFTVNGTASNNWQVAGVWFQINTNGWLLVTTTNGYHSWSATNVILTVGTNMVRAYAVDPGGNYSSTNTLAVVATNVLALNAAMSRPVVVLSGTCLLAGGCQFNLQITGGVSGFIQSSTNLMDWETVTNFSGTNTTINFCDPNASSYAHKYYRAVVP